jgi:hypothetical protein
VRLLVESDGVHTHSSMAHTVPVGILQRSGRRTSSLINYLEIPTPFRAVKGHPLHCSFEPFELKS